MMNKKATGWVPDYPDIRDLTLKSEPLKKLLSQVKGTQVSGSIESQKEEIFELFEQIAIAVKDPINQGKIKNIIKKTRENELQLIDVETDDKDVQKNKNIGQIPDEIYEAIGKKYLRK